MQRLNSPRTAGCSNGSGRDPLRYRLPGARLEPGGAGQNLEWICAAAGRGVLRRVISMTGNCFIRGLLRDIAGGRHKPMAVTSGPNVTEVGTPGQTREAAEQPGFCGLRRGRRQAVAEAHWRRVQVGGGGGRPSARAASSRSPTLRRKVWTAGCRPPAGWCRHRAPGEAAAGSVWRPRCRSLVAVPGGRPEALRPRLSRGCALSGADHGGRRRPAQPPALMLQCNA